MSNEETYGVGKHPNSLANLRTNTFSATNQPVNNNTSPGRQPGKTMKTLFADILDRKMIVVDVIAGAGRKVSIQEGTLLLLIEAAFLKKQQWAIERIMKEALGDDILGQINVNHILSPAAMMILEKAGVAEQARIIEGEIIEEDIDISELLE